MNVPIGNYEIRPYPNGLCWEVWEYRDIKSKKGTRKDWVSMGVYPSTFGHALAVVYEHQLKDEPGMKDLHAAITTSKRLYKALMDAYVDIKEAINA